MKSVGHRLAKLVVLCGYLFASCFLPYFMWRLHEDRYEKHIIAWFSAGFFVILAVPLSFYEIVQHLRHYNQPFLQRYVVRILWMVPLYSVESWVSLRYKEHALLFTTIREIYEAYVIYCFTCFLILYLGTDDQIIAILIPKLPERGVHISPLGYCIKPWVTAEKFLLQCKAGVLQYVIIKLCLSLLVFLLQSANLYGEGEFFNFQRGYIYVVTINNFSQMWAMYCLILFYTSTKEELSPVNPLPKFLCVKLVVFFSFWQGVGIAFLVQTGVLHGTLTYSVDEVATGLQDFLICIEMFVAAIAHVFVFSHKDYRQESTSRVPFIRFAFLPLLI